MEVVAGTYEEIVLGYKVINVDSENQAKFENIFSDHSHGGSVRAVSANQRGILATGGSDENINLFNLKRNVEIGSLSHHNGTITCLDFFKKTHLFSSSEDGTIGVWQVGRWECLRSLKGHNGAVTSISVHPSGKLALSVGHDKTLRTWNLITGKCAYVVNIKQVAEAVLWSPGGNFYLATFGHQANVYSVKTGAVSCTLKPGFRLNTVKFIKDDVVVFGGEEGRIALCDIDCESPTYSFTTDTNRVKDLCTCPCYADSPSFWIVSASSNGKVQLWKLLQNGISWSHKMVCQIDAKFRLTCLALYYPKASEPCESNKLNLEFKEELVSSSDDLDDMSDMAREDVMTKEKTKKQKRKQPSQLQKKETLIRKKQKRMMKGAT